MPGGNSSPWRAIIESMFWIPNKHGQHVPFKLNWAQVALDAKMTGRDLVPKARQLGISTYMLARFTAQCMTNKNWRAVVISHEEEATKRLLARSRYMIEHMQIQTEEEDVSLVLPTERLSASEIRFGDTGSWFFIGTAGSKTFGRGDTIHALHGSEVAYWPNAHDLLGGLLGSVPDDIGEVVLESTGNGVSDEFARRVTLSLNGKSYWKTHFFPWWLEPSYRSGFPSEAEKKAFWDNLDEELEEPRLAKDFDLDAEQLHFRRRRIHDMAAEGQGYIDLHKVKQEFPTVIDDCFQASGNTVFERVKYEPTKDWVRTIGRNAVTGRLLGHPRADYHYVVGVDASGGVGKDNAVIQIGCIEKNEQVLSWASNRTPPDALASFVAEFGHEFNQAYIVVESNNHGLVTLQCLRYLANGEPIYPQHLIHKHRDPDPEKKDQGLMDMGYYTQARTKALAVGRAVQLCANGFIIHDEMTHLEQQAFGETEAGRLEGLDGSNDDRVMALVMMSTGWTRAMLLAAPDSGPVSRRSIPFSVEDIQQRILKGKQKDRYPIKAHLRGSNEDALSFRERGLSKFG